jgi:hypothetical protein
LTLEEAPSQKRTRKRKIKERHKRQGDAKKGITRTPGLAPLPLRIDSSPNCIAVQCNKTMSKHDAKRLNQQLMLIHSQKILPKNQATRQTKLPK